MSNAAARTTTAQTTTAQTTTAQQVRPVPDHVDVLVVGAGISGLGAARYLATERPGDSFAIVEARHTIGGTWDLFKYPGIRSDSDLYTFGYDFKPWSDPETIATAPRIMHYLQEMAEENGLLDHVHYGHRVVGASWSSDEARWTIDLQVSADPTDPEAPTTSRQVTASWIFCGGGYYRYDEGFTPEFEGRERFTGQIVHPQAWPEDLDYTGKKVVVIGSGATAVTLAPSMADAAEHVTILQRTPSYVMPVPRVDKGANLLKKVLSPERAHALIRAKYIAQQRYVYKFAQRFPKQARKLIRRVNQRMLPADFDIDTHFNPPYNPWDQRLCAVPGGDLFKVLSRGQASMVTDRIASFTETGIALESGEHLDADIIVTATGLNLQLVGGMKLAVDGEPVDFASTVVYRGTMLSGVPNFAMAIGYTNSSWTLKVGLLCEYFIRLLDHLDARGKDAVWVEADPTMPTRPLLDFGAGYVQRAVADLPKQGPEEPWVMSMDHVADRAMMRSAGFDDPAMHFATAGARAAEPVPTP